MAADFNQLSTGDSVFLDANTLVYHYQPHPIHGQACSQLLSRIEQQDLQGYTATHVLSELGHRLMMVEASSLSGWTAGKIKLRLRQHPAALANLTQFRRAIEALLQYMVISAWPGQNPSNAAGPRRRGFGTAVASHHGVAQGARHGNRSCIHVSRRDGSGRRRSA